MAEDYVHGSFCFVFLKCVDLPLIRLVDSFWVINTNMHKPI